MPISNMDALKALLSGQYTEKDGYIEVPSSLFITSFDINQAPLPEVDFYYMKDSEPTLLRKSGDAFPAIALSVHPTILIRSEDGGILKSFADRHLLNPPGLTGAPLQKRMTVLMTSTEIVVEDLFKHPTPENIQRSARVVGSLVHTIMKSPDLYPFLSSLSKHDSYTVRHSVGAGMAAIILAKKIGFKEENDIYNVGIAGLLHDIGKVKISLTIINKPGPLSDEEWVEMRKHPEYGHEMIKDNPNIVERSKRAILEHHEDPVGGGYPQKLKSADLDLYSKMICMCDIFNALTTDRPYSRARTPYDAFQFIQQKLPHKVDNFLLRQLIQIYGGSYE